VGEGGGGWREKKDPCERGSDRERKRRENKKKNPEREGEIEKEKRVLAMKIKGYLS
jgi:hypothetical protein